MHIMELLRTSLHIDARLKAVDPKAVKLPPAPIKPLLPVEEDEFGGNENNRRAAAKLAAQKETVATGKPMPVETAETKEDSDRLSESQREAAMKAAIAAGNRPAPGGESNAVTAPAPWNPNA